MCEEEDVLKSIFCPGFSVSVLVFLVWQFSSSFVMGLVLISAMFLSLSALILEMQ